MQWIDSKTLNTFNQNQTNVHRLGTASSCWIERYHEDYIICHLPSSDPKLLISELENKCARLKLTINRIYSKLITNHSDLRGSPVIMLRNTHQPSSTQVKEWGLNYNIQFDAGYSHGFFMDQRMNRHHLREILKKKPHASVLNTFAYTCSFSVVSASCGNDTISIDLLKSYLDKGRQNFQLNHILPDDHAFFSGDVREYLPRFMRQNRKFDVIILDPPTFSHAKKKGPFRIEKELPEMINLCLKLLSSTGQLLISTNYTALTTERLSDMVQTISHKSETSFHFHEMPKLPDIPAAHMPSSLWINKI